jgi:hypothetical protein
MRRGPWQRSFLLPRCVLVQHAISNSLSQPTGVKKGKSKKKKWTRVMSENTSDGSGWAVQGSAVEALPGSLAMPLPWSPSPTSAHAVTCARVMSENTSDGSGWAVQGSAVGGSWKGSWRSLLAAEVVRAHTLSPRCGLRSSLPFSHILSRPPLRRTRCRHVPRRMPTALGRPTRQVSLAAGPV